MILWLYLDQRGIRLHSYNVWFQFKVALYISIKPIVYVVRFFSLWLRYLVTYLISFKVVLWLYGPTLDMLHSCIFDFILIWHYMGLSLYQEQLGEFSITITFGDSPIFQLQTFYLNFHLASNFEISFGFLGFYVQW